MNGGARAAWHTGDPMHADLAIDAACHRAGVRRSLVQSEVRHVAGRWLVTMWRIDGTCIGTVIVSGNPEIVD